MLQKSKEYVASRAYILLTGIVFCSVLGIGYSVIKLDRDSHLSGVRRDVEQALHHATDQIKLRFFGAVLVANKIEGILALSDEVPERQIAAVVEDLQRHTPGVIAVALAPGLTITHSFPHTGNKKTIGLKYWEVPAQMPSVARAYRWRRPVVAGPISLVQGGTGFILRYPVFLAAPGQERDQFWGIISIVIKADGLFNNLLHDFGDPDGYVFSLREVHASGLPYTYLGNDPGTFDDQPVVSEFTMLGNQWQAVVRPVHGWPSYSPQSPYLLGFALLSAIVLVAVLSSFRSLALKRENAHALLIEAIDCMDEGFIAFDDKERLVIANQTYQDYHPELADVMTPGKTFEELLRLAVKRHQFPEAINQETAWMAERLKRFRRPSASFLQHVGDERWLKVTEAKTPHGYTVGIRTDVTAEKRAQKAAEAADREKTEFLNNVSHELRTPLTVIFGRASFLGHAEKLPQSKRLQEILEGGTTSNEEIASALNNYQRFVSEQGAGIAKSAQHMLRLVEDLLDWTKVARGQFELELVTTQVDEIAESVVEDLRQDAETKGLALTYSNDGATEAIADQIRLKQILYNLVSNAIKFTDVGSVHLSVMQEGEQTVLCVTDTGCGISEENVERVFLRFHQVDGSMSRQNGGLGLGLAIAEKLAILHGGTLSVESTVGKGSTFRLSLPRTYTAIALKKSA